MIYSDPLIWQFVGDTFPEMIFACAWTLLVGFFVQLVGIVTGGVTSTTPGLVMLVSALSVYACLVMLQLRNSVASVLMYALLCCIYAALLGTVIYFCPRLVSLLKPSLQQQHGGAVLRLTLSSVACILLFAAHVVTYARRVIAPPNKVYWWWHYGILELLPSITFLLIMNPGSRKGSSPDQSGRTNQRKFQRTDSASSANSSTRRPHESIGLLRPNNSYGGTES